jgi:hypothetical protein
LKSPALDPTVTFWLPWTLRKLKLDSLLHSRRSKDRDPVVAMIVARILEPASKLATSQGLEEQAFLDTLTEDLERQGIPAAAANVDKIAQDAACDFVNFYAETTP